MHILRMARSRFTLRALATVSLLALLVLAGMALAPGAAAQGDGTPALGGTIVVQTVSDGPIYVIQADPLTSAAGSNLRYLTTGIDPALSPDGRQVAFTRWDDTQHGATGSLWVINVDDTGERMIQGNIHQPKAPISSPDGSKIAISMQQGGRLQPEFKCGRELPSEPLLADRDGDYYRVVVKVEEDGSVETKLCYTLLPHPHWSLRLVDVTTGTSEDLPGDRFSYAPAWDPANDWRLIYDGEQGLVNMDLNQGTTWPLTDDINDHAPVFSPDGSKIAVSYWQHDHWDIHVLNADGSGRVRLTETPLRVIVEGHVNGQEGRVWNNAAPTWSPDGNHIAFLTDRTGRWEMWAMSANGSQQQPLFGADIQDQLSLRYNSVDERVMSWTE